MENCEIQDFQHRRVQTNPLWTTKLVAPRRRMDVCRVQDLRCVQVPNPGNGSLVQQRYFNGAPAMMQTVAQLLGRQLQRVGSQFARLAMKMGFELGGGKKSDRAETATIPKQELLF